jgi:hypothetical protein
MNSAVAVVAIAGVLATSAAAAGQVREVKRADDRLHGMTAVDIVVETSAPTGDKCRPTDEALQRVARAALAALGVQASVSERASSSFNTVYVRAESTRAAGQCVSAVAADLVTHVDGIPDAERALPRDAWGSLLVGELSLIRRFGLVASSAADHERHVERAVADHLGAIGARIRAANKK